MDGPDPRPRCDYLLLGPDRRLLMGRCPNPARFTVVANRKPYRDSGGGWPWRADGPNACGVHVRPALMDNGDSVWKPWVVERIGVVPPG